MWKFPCVMWMFCPTAYPSLLLFWMLNDRTLELNEAYFVSSPCFTKCQRVQSPRDNTIWACWTSQYVLVVDGVQESFQACLGVGGGHRARNPFNYFLAFVLHPTPTPSTSLITCIPCLYLSLGTKASFSVSVYTVLYHIVQQCLSNFGVHVNHWRVLLKCIVWFSWSIVRPDLLHF